MSTNPLISRLFLTALINSVCPDTTAVEVFRKMVLKNSNAPSNASWQNIMHVFDQSIRRFQGLEAMRPRPTPEDMSNISPQMHLAYGQFVIYCTEHTGISLNLSLEKELAILDKALEIAIPLKEQGEISSFIQKASNRKKNLLSKPQVMSKFKRHAIHSNTYRHKQ